MINILNRADLNRIFEVIFKKLLRLAGRVSALEEGGGGGGGAVTSVAGRTGVVTLTKADVALGNVDNTPDSAKPISTATQTALDGKQATLVNQTNIKSVGGVTLLGAGNIPFPAATIPAGATTQLQYNNAGAFGASANAVYTAAGGLNVQPSATAATAIRAGALEFTSYAVNNSFMMENLYYDIATPGYKLRSAGYGGLFQFYNGGFTYSGIASGAAGASVSPSAVFSIDGPGATNGRVMIGNLGGTGTRTVQVDASGYLVSGSETGVVTNRTITASDTILTTDNLLFVDCSLGAVNLTFPGAVTPGKSYRIAKIDNTSNPINFVGITVNGDAASGIINIGGSAILYARTATAYHVF